MRLKKLNTAAGIRVPVDLIRTIKGEEGMKERAPVPRDPLPSSVYVLWIAAIVVLAGLGVLGLVGR